MFASTRFWLLPTITTLLMGLCCPAAMAHGHQPSSTSIENAEPEPEVGYKGGFFLRSDAFEIKIRSRLQARYAVELLDYQDNKTAFSLHRARLALGGHAFTPRLAYFLQVGFDKGTSALKDFLVDFEVAPWLRLRAGQWKIPFSRQQVTSSCKLALVDRSITHAYLGVGRDIGVAIHNDYERTPRFEYVLGLFNGTGVKGTLSGPVQGDPLTGEGALQDASQSNVPHHLKPTLVARIGYNHGGIRYDEADLLRGPLRFAVAANAMADFDGDGDDVSAIRAHLDYALKLRGFSSSGGFFVTTAQDGEAFADQSFAAMGLRVQAGYLLGRRVQLALRYAHVIPDGADNDRQEILGGVTLYIFEHGLKLQADGGALIDEQASASKRKDIVMRTQLQFAF